MQAGGLTAEQISQVRGYSDRRLRYKDNGKNGAEEMPASAQVSAETGATSATPHSGDKQKRIDATAREKPR